MNGSSGAAKQLGNEQRPSVSNGAVTTGLSSAPLASPPYAAELCVGAHYFDIRCTQCWMFYRQTAAAISGTNCSDSGCLFVSGDAARPTQGTSIQE